MRGALDALRRHWPEYLIEAAGLGVFMVSAGLFATLLEHPGSPVRLAIDDPLLRRFLMGAAMGLTAVAIIYSPWGRQSGAHLNPAVTLTFLRLGRVAPWDAAFYAAAQVAGGIAGVALAAALMGGRFTEPPILFVATLPGHGGVTLAFLAEAAIAFVLMTAVLNTAGRERLMRYTGLVAGGLVCLFITVEAPLSGMSLNPARSLASAVPSGIWAHAWIYLLAPPLGMLLAAELHRALGRQAEIRCAKLNHATTRRCIFRCGHAAAAPSHAHAPAAGGPVPASPIPAQP